MPATLGRRITAAVFAASLSLGLAAGIAGSAAASAPQAGPCACFVPQHALADSGTPGVKYRG